MCFVMSFMFKAPSHELMLVAEAEFLALWVFYPLSITISATLKKGMQPVAAVITESQYYAWVDWQWVTIISLL